MTKSQYKALSDIMTSITSDVREVTDKTIRRTDDGDVSFIIVTNFKKAPKVTDSKSFVGMITPRGKVTYF